MPISTQPIIQDDQTIDDILNTVKTIAVVGASPNPDRVSYQIMVMLMEHGYDVIPINPRPGLEEIAGVKVFPDLGAVDRAVDMVDVFRKPEHLMAVASDAIAIKAKVLWGQLGVVDEEAARLARDAGIKVVMDRCPKIELDRIKLDRMTKSKDN